MLIPDNMYVSAARLCQVWDFDRSAEMRDTEGGASKRSVKEQVAKMRAYLAANRTTQKTPTA